MQRFVRSWLGQPSAEMRCLDVLRIVASLMIVVYHFNGQVELRSGPLAWPSHLSIAVDLFFMISGFVITRYYGGLAGGHDYRTFLAKRIARLYPLHLATLAAFLVIGLVAVRAGLSFRTPGQFDLRCLPSNLLLVQSLGFCDRLTFNQVSWSISAEFLLYLGFPVLLLARRAHHLLVPVLALAGFALLVVVAPDGSPAPWYLWTFDGGVLRAMPSFALGAAAYDGRRLIARLPYGEAGMWATLIGTGLLLDRLPGTALIGLLFVAALFAIAADEAGRASPVARAVAPWAVLTYSIYMLHPLVDIIGLSFVGKKLLRLHGAALDLLVLAAIPATVLCAAVSFRRFEGPARRWTTGLLTRHAPRRAPAADLHGPV